MKKTVRILLCVVMFGIILCANAAPPVPGFIHAAAGKKFVPKVAETLKVKLAVVGDIMCHDEQLNNFYDKSSDSYDFTPQFSSIKPYLADADYTIGNLEFVLGGKAMGYSGYPMFNGPDAYAKAIKDAGVDFLSTANNHCNDRREKGLLQTLQTLDELGFDHAGTYASQQDRDSVFVNEINGVKFAFLSYTYGTNGIAVPAGKEYQVNLISEELLKSDIAAARALNPDFVVVIPHMGNEYETAPKQVFKNWVSLMLDAGADIILASHPHVLQPAEFRTIQNPDGTERRCFVIYSLGNFVSAQRTIPRDSGVVLNLYIEKQPGEKAEIKLASLIPTWVRFNNLAEKRAITVLPLSDQLIRLRDGETLDIMGKDIARLSASFAEFSKMYFKGRLSQDDLRREYVLEM